MIRTLVSVLRELNAQGGDGRKSTNIGVAPDCIVVTAARDLGTVRAAMQLGAVYYLVKPFGLHGNAGRPVHRYGPA